MADLVLCDSLVDEYLKYKFNTGFDKNKTQKLLKHIHPFPLKMNHPKISEPTMLMQLEGSDPLIEISDIIDDSDLVQNSRLKLMLTDEPSSLVSLFTTLNILNTYEKLKPKFGATYPNKENKIQAQNHIKALLSDATWIKITDAYIAAYSSWHDNKSLIKSLFPHSSLNITIVGSDIQKNEMSLDQMQKNEIEGLCTHWKVSCKSFDTKTMHDRYIETDKMKILLSSGLCHLSESSSKDFTYIIELK